jgi:ATP-dependent DNA helicase RecG
VITADSPVAAVFGRQHKKRKRVEDGLGLRTVGDLLHHFPRRYLETQEPTAVTNLAPGQLVSVVGEVLGSKVSPFRNRQTNKMSYRVEVRVRTGGPTFAVTFFSPYERQARDRVRQLAPGARGLFTGRTKVYRDTWQLTQPQAVVFDGGSGESDGEVSSLAGSLRGLVPVYPLTSGLYTFDVQRAVQAALELVEDVPDVLGPQLCDRYDLVDVMTALRLVHGPDDRAQLGTGLRRFRFEEALVLQLVLARRRAALRQAGGQARTGGGGLLAAFDARLPFTLTDAQRRVGAEIEEDLARPYAMNRLLQGEVGSGKTLVALRAMLRVVDSGGQAGLLAPTEVLAQQHHRSITAMLGDLAAGGMLGGHPDGTGVALLTGSAATQQRRQALLDAASGEAGIVIGTHALLEERVSFADLGLVVVDEQHRFGVEQRAALTAKADSPPHVLVMTATPIPRTVAMTVFGDLETSTIAELPAGRAPVQTTVVPLAEHPGWMDRVWERVREEVSAGHQAYVVCPRISGDTLEEGEADQVDYDEDGDALTPASPAGPEGPAAVEDLAPGLAEGALSGLRVAALHGRMPPEAKDRTMRAFAAGEVDVLVSTTVVEVGVDVPNATAMVLADADRFGVSQLHQLRGRVGRGGHPGICLLVSGAQQGTPARERLDAVAATTDGFELSRVDLEQRREGDVLGAHQSGFASSLETLRVLRDESTIVAARDAAEALLAEDPELAGRPLLRDAVQTVEHSQQSEYLEKT